MTNKQTNPKILFFDIETSPCLATVWGTGKQYVGADQIQKERKILCISYIWSDDYDKGKKPVNLKMDMSKHDILKFDDDADKAMIKKFMKVYSTADLAVAHNGLGFDKARIRARLFKYGLPDINQYVLFDDSYQFTKSIDMTSHKMDYIAKVLGTARKTGTNYGMWVKVLYGHKKSLTELSDYCGHDVLALVPVYRRSLPYAKSKLNMTVYREDPTICVSPGCGGSLLKNGFRYTTTGRYQIFKCSKCSKQCTGGKNEIKSSSKYPR